MLGQKDFMTKCLIHSRVISAQTQQEEFQYNSSTEFQWLNRRDAKKSEASDGQTWSAHLGIQALVFNPLASVRLKRYLISRIVTDVPLNKHDLLMEGKRHYILLRNAKGRTVPMQ